MLDSRIHDILTLAFFLLWRHLIDDLLLLLGFLLSQQSCLLSRKLIILGGFLGRMMPPTLKGREEIIEQDTLARLHLSPFALGCLLLAIGGARFRCATAARAHRRNDVLGVNLSSRLCIVAMLLGGGLRVAGSAVMEYATGLWAFGGAAALGPGWKERGRFRAHGAIRVLLNDGLLLLDDLLELLFAELAEEFFVKDGHYATFLLLCYQLLQKNGLIILRRHM